MMTAPTLSPPLQLEAPWSWTREAVEAQLNERQLKYVRLLERVFRVKTADGRVVDYHMQPFQAWFHAHSPLAMGRSAPDRLVEKGRGLGLTTMTAMDLMMLAHTKDRVHIPVAGRQSTTGDEFIRRCHELAADTVVEGFFDVNTELRSRWQLVGNESSVDPVPGGNPASLRSRRAVAMCYDEYAFHPNATELWRAGRGVLSEGGQLTILSTHDGSGTDFYRLIEGTRHGEHDFALFTLPVHDRDAFDRSKPIQEQVDAGTLVLIAPWLDVGELDKLRREDLPGYAQENLCEVMDETLNLIPRAAIENVHHIDVESWERVVSVHEDVDLAGRAPVPTIAARPEKNGNPVTVGVDFASKGDLAAYTAIEATPTGLEQRWLLALSYTDTPTQNRLLRLLVAKLRPSSVLIDMTGPGTGLYEYAERELPTNVIGINFGDTVDVGKETAPIKKAMALNLSLLVLENRIRLLGMHPLTNLQKRHLAALRRADLDAPRKAGEGHADIFWAVAMAAWGHAIGASLPRARQAVKKSSFTKHQPGQLYGR